MSTVTTAATKTEITYLTLMKFVFMKKWTKMVLQKNFVELKILYRVPAILQKVALTALFNNVTIQDTLGK